MDYGAYREPLTPEFSKAQWESKDFQLSWAVRLNGDSILTSVWESDAFTIVSSSVVGTRVTARLSGGANGKIHAVTNTITTVNGYTYARKFAVKVDGPTVSNPRVDVAADEFDLMDGAVEVSMDFGDGMEPVSFVFGTPPAALPTAFGGLHYDLGEGFDFAQMDFGDGLITLETEL